MARFPQLQVLSLLFLLHLSLQLQCSHALQPRQIYIVYLGERQHEDADLVTASHHDMLASILGSKDEALESIVYSYKYGFSGFSARLTKSQARKIQGLPGVVSVKKNQIRRLRTTRSWDFVGLDYKQPNGLLAKAHYGDGIIVGVIDSGVWPESPSFADDGSYGPPPSKWKGICQPGVQFGPHNCNRKLIGARWYADDMDNSTLEGEFLSARDAVGHGTHTASTAAGNLVRNASLVGLAAGTVRGGAPRARVAMYKACWSTGGCSDARMLKAVDDAIHDGVDVLSVSIGGAKETPGMLHAVTSGIPVVYAGGNDGPTAQTVENSSPWLFTVAAATIDRSFPTVITLGNNQKLVAQSFFVSGEVANQFYPLKVFVNDECDPGKIDSTVHGKIVFCWTPDDISVPLDFTAIAFAVKRKGGNGLIFPQYRSTDSISNLEQLIPLNLPYVPVDNVITYQIAQYCEAYSNHDGPKAKISFTQTMIGSEVPAPKIAAFSSRGPSPNYPGVLKPDIAAPGVTILAAAAQIGIYERTTYHFESGTSMACPHVSGIIAVLKSLHPDWSPAALKSALMTTALTADTNGAPIQADGNPAKIADPFDYGAGFVNPIKAADPGLIYDINPSDYIKFFNCNEGLGADGNCTTPKGSIADLNLPSIAVPNLRTSVTVVRTVTNVGQPYAVYRAFFQPPAGVIKMAVEPPVLVFSKERRVQSFKVTFTATRRMQASDYSFGSLAWHDGASHWVRIPIAVRIIIDEFYSYVN